MADLDDVYSDPNAGAYEKRETRVGPPLSYVGEKARCALEKAHATFQLIQSLVPDTLPTPTAAGGAGGSLRQDLLRSAEGTFYFALVAFLALNNSLGRISGDRKVEALLELHRADFEAWLDSVEQEGSVTG